jgi:hypothetical protein
MRVQPKRQKRRKISWKPLVGFLKTFLLVLLLTTAIGLFIFGLFYAVGFIYDITWVFYSKHRMGIEGEYIINGGTIVALSVTMAVALAGMLCALVCAYKATAETIHAAKEAKYARMMYAISEAHS